VAFGVFSGLASTYAALTFLASRGSDSSAYAVGSNLIRMLGWSVAVVGAGAVFCSVMIYVFTQRECWSFARVLLRFVSTSALLGIAVVWFTILGLALAHPSPELTQLVRQHGASLCGSLIVLAGTKLLWEAAIFRHLFSWRMTPLKRSALLMSRELSSIVLARFAAGALGGVVMPAFLLMSFTAVGPTGDLPKFVIITGILFVACLVGELLERALFFAACAAPRMPGSIG
jgi:hypothetical protein